jgi:hypothetical protein
MSVIKRGLLTNFYPATYRADVLLVEATSTFLQNVPLACHFDGTSSQVNGLCAVLFFDEQNYSDAVVLAVYPNGSAGVPTPPPGRLTFVAGTQQASGQVITAGSTLSLTVTGSGGIPLGALGVLYKLSLTSTTAGAFVHVAPFGASNLAVYATVGTVQPANTTLYGTGVVALDSTGRLAIQAQVGTCTVSLWTYGYVV